MLMNWIKVFIYQLKQNKLFSILNTLGLAIGISGIIFAILYWNEEHSYNEWNPEKENVFQVVNDLGGGNIWASNVAPMSQHIKAWAPEVESFCYLNNWYFKEIISLNGKKELVDKIMDSQSNFFSFFPFEFIEGDGKTAIRDDSSMAISEETAIRFFGNQKVLGKQLHYAGKDFVIRGVYRIPGKSSIAPAVVTSLIEPRIKENMDQWGNFNFGLLIKLKDPSQKELLKKHLEDIYLEYRTKPNAKQEGIALAEFIKKHETSKVILESLAESRLHSVVQGYPEGKGNYTFLLIMVGLSALIMLLSIVNYINLATANAIRRAKEVGVRRIIGASKGNIISQFLMETVFVSLFSILLALAIVELSLPYYNDFLGKDLVMNGEEFYLQLLLIFLAVIVLAGIFPAFYVSNFETLKVLKGNFGRSKSGVWLRNGMLILQFSIATFFIVGSYIVHEQVSFLAHKDIGFKSNQVVDIFMRRQSEVGVFNRYLTIKQELLKIPGVKQVSGSAFAFGEGSNSSSGFEYKDSGNIQAWNIAADFGILNMMKIKIEEGRDLSESLSSDTINSILLNRTAIRMMGEKDPIGKIVNWNSQKLKIVGVVSDFHINGPHNQIPPMTFMHFKTVRWMEGNMNHVFVKIAPENMEQTMAAMEKYWTTKVDTEYPFNYDFVDAKFKRTYETFVKQEHLFSLLNTIVIVIALFGLFALASFSIERRMKEIAIRKTLGAETSSLLKELSKQYLLFCLVGFLVAFLPTRFVLASWLEDFAYRIDISIYPFVIGFAVLCSLTLVVVLLKAYRATRIDVLQYLKYE